MDCLLVVGTKDCGITRCMVVFGDFGGGIVIGVRENNRNSSLRIVLGRKV